jgi:hypothetical protein
VTCEEDSEQGDEHNQESLKRAQPMRSKIASHLRDGEHNEDDAYVSHRRQQQKLLIVDEMLFEKQRKSLSAEYIIGHILSFFRYRWKSH